MVERYQCTYQARTPQGYDLRTTIGCPHSAQKKANANHLHMWRSDGLWLLPRIPPKRMGPVERQKGSGMKNSRGLSLGACAIEPVGPFSLLHMDDTDEA